MNEIKLPFDDEIPDFALSSRIVNLALGSVKPLIYFLFDILSLSVLVLKSHMNFGL